jgi:hypothetical protein
MQDERGKKGVLGWRYGRAHPIEMSGDVHRWSGGDFRKEAKKKGVRKRCTTDREKDVCMCLFVCGVGDTAAEYERKK